MLTCLLLSASVLVLEFLNVTLVIPDQLRLAISHYYLVL